MSIPLPTSPVMNLAGGRTGFADWVDTLSPTDAPTTVLAYGAKYGYTPGQLANFYNSTRGTSWTPEESFGIDYSGMLGSGYHSNNNQGTPLDDATAYQIASGLLSGGGGDVTPSNPLELWDPDAYPTSWSSGSGSSSSGGTTFSGIDPQYSTPVMNAVIPQLTRMISDMPSMIDRYTSNAAKMYENQARQSITEAMPTVLNSLANRRIIGGNLVPETISRSLSTIFPEFANKAYEAGMTGAQMQYGLPSILAAIAGLGNTSTGINFSNSVNQTDSGSRDPSVPIANLLDFLSVY